MNFGAFATPEDNVLFDINDFDETLPGVDFTIDLKRLVASVAVAALSEGFAKKRARAIAAGTAKAYRDHIRGLADLTPLGNLAQQDRARAGNQAHRRNEALRRRLEKILRQSGKAAGAGR